MSDRSPFQLYVYALTEDDEAAVLQAIAEVGDMEPDDPAATKHGTTIVRGMRYLTAETPLDTADEISAYLTEHAPSAVFELWRDPVYEFGGYYIAHVPGVGTYAGECDANGNPYVSLTALLDSAAATDEGTTVRDWIRAEHPQVANVLTALRPHKAAHGR